MIIGNTGTGIQAAAAEVVLTDNVITDNIAEQGGGISVSTVENGRIVLTNNTVTGNRATNRGGGVSVLVSTNETVYFYNNIIWGNDADSGGDDIRLSNLFDEGKAYAYNNDYSLLSGDWTEAADNIDADPVFVDAEAGDWRLDVGSPCIDTGTNDALELSSSDKDGKARVHDGNGDGSAIVDMGSYEYGSSAESPTPTPSVTPTVTPGAVSCLGDCGGDGLVTVDELLKMVNIALGLAAIENCLAGDANDDGQITIDELVSAVNHALTGCP
jgi:hypothetical protein